MFIIFNDQTIVSVVMEIYGETMQAIFSCILLNMFLVHYFENMLLKFVLQFFYTNLRKISQKKEKKRKRRLKCNELTYCKSNHLFSIQEGHWHQIHNQRNQSCQLHKHQNSHFSVHHSDSSWNG